MMWIVIMAALALLAALALDLVRALGLLARRVRLEQWIDKVGF
jgi:hypothetical protein